MCNQLESELLFLDYRNQDFGMLILHVFPPTSCTPDPTNILGRLGLEIVSFFHYFHGVFVWNFIEKYKKKPTKISLRINLNEVFYMQISRI